ncbi:lipid phosphate phosphatase 2-like isoform X2 [Phoenix dactylifera]|uniref:Lipid phosphate phosphatase 2-like isoform X2 n=1 Tax=Phoenix dactylifera TaxID=42345 RepID=A0A8B7BNT4_PHODC|nr:lipid phosphate phosphatase 2-like isoform X2 [Phoenix dactylifera]
MPSCWLLNSRRRDNMGEIQLGSHTVQSHGVKVAKIHKHDWFIVVFLMMLVVALNIIHPFYRFVGKDMMTDLKYPLKSDTVPVWAVPMISVLLPIAVFVAVYFRRRDVYDLHHAILGLLFSVLITGVITDALKDAVGRPRPDFYWRCFPDGKELYDRVTGNVICHGDRNLVKDGHKSFPSGHTSCLGFLALYLSGKIKAFDQRGHVAKLCIVFVPLLVACLIGISAVDDYRHHWQDVFAGGLLGIIVATFCYLQFYPAPYHADGWGPYASFQVLAESRANPTNAANQQPEGSDNNGLPRTHQNRTEPNDLESGRM